MNIKLFSSLKFLKSRLKISVLLLLLTSTMGFHQVAVADAAQDSTVIAAITLNLARYSEWPAAALRADDPNIRLCILADSATQQAFAEIDRKQVGIKTLDVINIARIKNIGQCHVLYVDTLDRIRAIQLLSEIGRRPVLTVGGSQSHFLEDGGMVNLEIINGRINIQINLNAVKQTGLRISSRVLDLATIFNP